MKNTFKYLMLISATLLFSLSVTTSQLKYSNGKIGLKGDMLQYGYIDPILEVSQRMVNFQGNADMELSFFGNPSPADDFCYDIQTKYILVIDLEYLPENRDFFAMWTRTFTNTVDAKITFKLIADYIDNNGDLRPLHTLLKSPGVPETYEIKIVQHANSSKPVSNHQQLIIELDYEIARSLSVPPGNTPFKALEKITLDDIRVILPINPIIYEDLKLTAKLYTYDIKTPLFFNIPGKNETDPIYQIVQPNNNYLTINHNFCVFEWQPVDGLDCFLKDGFPAYEIQILRLYNDLLDGSDYASLRADNKFLKGVVDWSKALSIISTNTPNSSGKVKDTITLAEGTGYYVWRVRPIGSRYDIHADPFFGYDLYPPTSKLDNPLPRFNSIEDVSEFGKAHYEYSANYGVWSDVVYQNLYEGLDPNGNTIIKIENGELGAITSPPTPTYGIFYYNQFDENINWVYKRSFHEEDYDGTFINESISYFDDLLKLRQTQTNMLTTASSKVVTHIVPDNVGRPALSTLPIPYRISNSTVTNESTGKNLGFEIIDYFADNYDGNTCTTFEPDPMQSIPVINRYYDSTSFYEEGVATSGGYPFTRIVYHRDNKNRPIIQSKAGDVHKVGGGKNIETYFASCSQDELNTMFGGVAPDAKHVHKQITVDENDVTSINYHLSDGKIIASSKLYDGSPQNLSSLNESYLSQDAEYDFNNEKFVESKTITIPTQITAGNLEFKFSIQSIIDKINLDECIDFCTDCDYKVKLIIRDADACDGGGIFLEDSTFYYPSGIPDGEGCFSIPSQPDFICTTSVDLPPDTYVFERIITVNNTLTPGELPQKEKIARDFRNSIYNQIDNDIAGSGFLKFDMENKKGTSLYNQNAGTLQLLLDDLESGSLTLSDFYDELELTHGLTPDYLDGKKAQYIYTTDCCGDITIPYLECPTCEIPNDNDYEAYLLDSWAGKQVEDHVLSDNITDYFYNPVYNIPFVGGYFNDMVDNMITDGLLTHKEACECWKPIVDLYDSYAFKHKNFPPDANGKITVYSSFNEKFNIVDAFLDCAGRKMKGFWGAQIPAPSGNIWQTAYKFLPGIYDDFDDLYMVKKITAILKDASSNMYPNWNTDLGGPYHKTFVDVVDVVNDPDYSGPGDGLHDTKPWEELYRAILGHKQGDDFKAGGYYEDGNPDNDDLFQRIFNLSAIPCGKEAEIETNPAYSDYKDIRLEFESECLTRCEAKREAARDQLIKMYNKDKKSVEGQTIKFDAAGNPIKCDPDDPDHDITSDMIECTLDHIIADCATGCGFAWEEESFPGETPACVYKLVPNDRDFMKMINGGIITEITKKPATGCPETEYPTSDIYREIVNSYDPATNEPLSCAEIDCDCSVNSALVYELNDWLNGTGANTLRSELGVYHPADQSNPAYYYYNGVNIIEGSPTFLNIVNDKYLQKYKTLFDQCWNLKCYEFDPEDIIPPTQVQINYDNPCTEIIPRNMQFNTSPGADPWTYNFLGDSRYEIFMFFSYFQSGTYSIVESGFCGLDVVYEEGTYGPPGAPPVRPREFRTTFCDHKCAFCVHYSYPDLEALDEYVIEYDVMDCEDGMAEEIRSEVRRQLNECKSNLSIDVESQYESICENPDNLVSETTVKFNTQQYHFTLYYYDRAGNLAATVPPKGVNFTNPQQHQMFTHYLYDTQNRLVQKISPEDHSNLATIAPHETYKMGEKYFYDEFGRLIYKVNFKAVTYFIYDDYNRLVETGEMLKGAVPILPSSGLDLADDMLFYNFNTPFAGELPHQRYQMFNIMDPSYDIHRNEYIKYVYDYPAHMQTPPRALPAPYETPSGTRYEQKNVFGRLSYSYRHPKGSFTDTDPGRTFTFYSYDAHGNVDWVIKSIVPLADPQDDYNESVLTSKIDYDYDLISGNISQIIYNKNRFNEFRQKYFYNEANNLAEVYTSRNGFLWDREAEYNYYRHGPVKQIKVGQDKLQLYDYTYTINGWLKAMNNSYQHAPNHLTYDYDVDVNGNWYDNSDYVNDLFGFKLEYHENDYTKLYTELAPHSNLTYPKTGYNNLYNGIVSAMTYAYSQNFSSDFAFGYWHNGTSYKISGYEYDYDIIYRLVNAQLGYFYESGGNPDFDWHLGTQSEVNIAYDANSNITSLTRMEDKMSMPLTRNNISYNYTSPTFPSNKLQSVNDGGSNQYMGVPSYSFNYDEIGRRTDKNTVWSFDNKVLGTYADDPNALGNIYYLYDEQGNRVFQFGDIDAQKRQYWVYGINGELLSHYKMRPTFYDPFDGKSVMIVVNDNIVLPWEETFAYFGGGPSQSNLPPEGPFLDGVYLENHLYAYGASPHPRVVDYRLEAKNSTPNPIGSTAAHGYLYNYDFKFDPTSAGLLFNVRERNYDPPGWPIQMFDLTTRFYHNRMLDTRRYEMKDHVGNVRVVYGDYRIDEFSDANKKNDKIVYSGFTDYYPYGLAMDNRQYQGESYLFGFQGMEQEPDQDETQYHTLFRQYDAVLGRWWSSDPEQMQFPSFSPYLAMGANPVNRIDPLGNAEYLADDLSRYDDGEDDNMKYVLDKSKLPYGPPSLDELKAASVPLPDEKTWGIMKEDIYDNISSSNRHEDIGAYGITGKDITYKYGGISKDYEDPNGRVGQDGTEATFNALSLLGPQDYKVAVHSHPHPRAEQKNSLGQVFNFSKGQAPHDTDYNNLWRTGAQAGMVINLFDVYIYTNSSSVKFEFDDLDDFINGELDK